MLTIGILFYIALVVFVSVGMLYYLRELGLVVWILAAILLIGQVWGIVLMN